MLALYAEEIDIAYMHVDDGDYEEVALPPSGLTLDDESAIQEYVEAVVEKVLQRRVPLHNDLFEAGLDSLSAMRVRSAILAALKKSVVKKVVVSQSLIYNLPTQAALIRYLQHALSPGEIDHSPHTSDINTTISEMLETFTTYFPQHRPTTGVPPSSQSVYAVTGTTGSLGLFFVSCLLKQPEVRRIYLLNRPSNRLSIEDRHRASFRAKMLNYDLLEQAVNNGRAVYLEVSFGSKVLGLEQARYDAV